MHRRRGRLRPRLRIVDPLAPPVDVCDGFDNDGDGEIDEDLVPQPGPCGTGACLADGITTCVDGAIALDCTPAAPGEERCGNRVDDDCDGLTDEGFDDGDPCAAGVGGCRALGQYVCTADGAATECDAVPGAPGVERCGNGVDDDCDGQTDEGFATGDPCQAGGGACLADGATACTADDAGAGVECGAEPGVPGEELCGNGVDDDCDGISDDRAEGFDLGAPCTGGLGLCRADGVTVCAPDGRGTVCDAPIGAPGPELCDTGEDEDCDGEIDEGFDLSAPCTVGIGTCARLGIGTCSADRLSLVCDAVPGEPTDEICGNDVDDDFDGETDEDFDEGEPCTVGVGACVATDLCDPILGCDYAFSDGPSDDGIACTRDDVCAEGSCVGTDDCPVGETCNGVTGLCTP